MVVKHNFSNGKESKEAAIRDIYRKRIVLESLFHKVDG